MVPRFSVHEKILVHRFQIEFLERRAAKLKPESRRLLMVEIQRYREAIGLPIEPEKPDDKPDRVAVETDSEDWDYSI